ncbi:MAG: hypothetical protein ACREMV_00100, partial [Gemmatimonadales bacterium]
MCRTQWLTLAAQVGLLALPPCAAGQSLYHPGRGDDGVTLQLLRPDFRFAGVENPSFTAFLGARARLGGTLRLVAELPFALVDDPVSGSTVGNPYLGVRFGATGDGAWGEFGLRAPLSSDEGEGAQAALFGFLSDPARLEAFATNVTMLSGLAGYRSTSADGLVIEAGGGPAALIPTGDGGDVELVLHFLLRAGWDEGAVRILGGFSGVTLLTENVGGVAERTIDQFTVTADIGRGAARPQLY